MLERCMRPWGVSGGKQITGDVLLMLLCFLVALAAAENLWGWLSAVFSVIALFVRRRWPATALIVGGLWTGMAVVPLSYSAGKRVPGVQRLMLAVGCFLVLETITLWMSGEVQPRPTELGLVATLSVSVVVIPMVIGRNVAQRQLLLGALRERAANLERERRSIVAETRMRERTRIAVDMHDTLGHQLTLISLHAGGLTVAANGDAQQTALILHDTARRAMSELRGIVGVLNEGDQHKAHEPKGVDNVPELLEAARSTGALVQFGQSGEPRPMGARAEHAIYRMLQEGLTNALRHAPGAPVWARITYEPDAVIAEVTNAEGRSGRTAGGGQGLVGLRERARLAGGVLHAGATSDHGFRLALVLPYVSEVLPEDEETAPEPASDELDVATIMESLRPKTNVLVAWIVTVLSIVITATFGMLMTISTQSGTLVLPQGTFDAMYVGQPEQQVLTEVDNAVLTAAHRLANINDGSRERCDYFYSADYGQGAHQPAYRLCFAGGTLTGKAQFDAPAFK